MASASRGEKVYNDSDIFVDGDNFDSVFDNAQDRDISESEYRRGADEAERQQRERQEKYEREVAREKTEQIEKALGAEFSDIDFSDDLNMWADFIASGDLTMNEAVKAIYIFKNLDSWSEKRELINDYYLKNGKSATAEYIKELQEKENERANLIKSTAKDTLNDLANNILSGDYTGAFSDLFTDIKDGIVSGWGNGLTKDEQALLDSYNAEYKEINDKKIEQSVKRIEKNIERQNEGKTVKDYNKNTDKYWGSGMMYNAFDRDKNEGVSSNDTSTSNPIVDVPPVVDSNPSNINEGLAGDSGLGNVGTSDLVELSSYNWSGYWAKYDSITRECWESTSLYSSLAEK